MWSKTPFLVTEAAICLPTIGKTEREKLTVRLSEREYFTVHISVQYAGVQRQKAHVMFVFTLTHSSFFLHCESELQHNDFCQLLPSSVRDDWDCYEHKRVYLCCKRTIQIRICGKIHLALTGHIRNISQKKRPEAWFIKLSTNSCELHYIFCLLIWCFF